MAIGSGSSDAKLATVKSPVVFDDPEKPFLCPRRGGSIDGTPVRSVKASANWASNGPKKKRTADERSNVVLRALGIEPCRASGDDTLRI